ncbi:MAG: hypothetical protein WB507_03810, partial [Solirubrobacterales bacterium]
MLLGSTAAIGLGLVALISSVGWPNALDSPIPGFPTEHVAPAHAIAVAPAGSGKGAPSAAAKAPTRPRPGGAKGTRAVAVGAFVAAHHPRSPAHPLPSGAEPSLTPAST